MNKLLTKDNISLGLASVTAIFLFINYFSDCHNRLTDAKRYHLVDAMNCHPQVVIFEQPKMISFEFKTAKRDDTDPSPATINEINIPLNITIKFNIKAVNNGNCVAKYVSKIFADDTSDNTEIRRLILEQKMASKTKIDSVSFFGFEEMRPGDTAIFEITHSFQTIVDNKYSFHGLLLYTNELGNYFDTYFIIPFESKDIFGRNYIELRHDTLIYGAKISKLDLVRSVKPQAIKQSWYTYNFDEQSILIDQLFGKNRLNLP